MSKRQIFLVGLFLIFGFSTAAAEEIKLSTIIPGSDVLRAAKGAVGPTIKDRTIAPGDFNGYMLFENGIVIGDRATDHLPAADTIPVPTHISVASYQNYPFAGYPLASGRAGGISLSTGLIYDWEQCYLELSHNLSADRSTYLTNGSAGFVLIGGNPDSEGAFQVTLYPNGFGGGNPAAPYAVDTMVMTRLSTTIRAANTITLNSTEPGGTIRLNAANIQLNGTVTGCTGSDIRLKKDITTIPNALGRIDSIRGVNFRWKDNKNDTSLHAGVIAQEVEGAFPELVTTDDKTGMKSVSYTEFTGVLIEAVKDLKKENNELKNRLAILEKSKIVR